MPPETISSHRFGTYTLVRKLGEGGMAEVFLGFAIDPDSGDLVPAAIKIAKPATVLGIDVDELFANEADLMSLLRHPGIVRFLEVGKEHGRFFIAMEFLSGGDLAGVLASLRKNRRCFPPALAVFLILQVLVPMAFVHQARGASGTPLMLIHGDVNPGNIFFDAETGAVKLGDFGVAVSQTMGVGLPEGMAGGKLNYLSPEQAGGQPLSPATDVFALAAVLFEMLFGVRPFEGGEPEEILARIAQCRFNDSIPMEPWQKAFFARAFSRKQKERFQTAGAMAGELARILLDDLGGADHSALCAFLNAALDAR